ncbi:MAG: dual specificity protein phosphatase family protein [Candidatus Saccharibacteria bacterium]|nr:dual specificity protein phosphatase family protein [Moraxellaceae bacterium]
MVKRVTFVSRTKAENTFDIDDCAVISISEPNSFLGLADLRQGWFEVLRMEFDDVDLATCGNQSNKFMSIHQARVIAAFVDSVAPEVSLIMVHCKAGISRSAAVAKWIAERYGLPFDHTYKYYNQHVYKQLDSLEALS